MPCSRAYSSSSLAAHLPRPYRRDHLQLRRERRDRRLDAHLVVALAGAPVRDRVAPEPARVLDSELRDQRPPKGREQRIAAAVEPVRLDRACDVLLRELLARVEHEALERPQLLGLRADRRVVLIRLSEVHGERHHLRLVAFLDPLQHHARVQPARVQQQDALHLRGVGLIGGGARELARGGRAAHHRFGSVLAPRASEALRGWRRSIIGYSGGSELKPNFA